MTIRSTIAIAALPVFVAMGANPAQARQLNMAPAIAAAVAEAAQTAAPKPAFEYSDGYHTRAKIHKIGSIAMVPLLATQGFLGASIYSDPTPTKKDWHSRVAWGIGGLFAANTVTGTMNLIEARKDPAGRKLRVAHALLMLASDAGFLATAVMAPDSKESNFADQRSKHRVIAFTSIGLATTGYLLMLFGHK